MNIQDEKKLRWKCRRGTKELDILVEKFLNNYYSNSSTSVQQAFKRMLYFPDPVLYDLIFGMIKPEDDFMEQVIEKINK